jgi:7tm Chemosensory receptor
MAVLHIILNVWTTNAPLIIPVSEYSELKEALLMGFEYDNIANIVFNFIGEMLISFIFILPNYFFLLVGMVLTIDFRHLSHDLELSIDEKGSWVSDKSLEWFRIRHSSLCSLLELADRIFSPWILLNIAFSTLQVLASIFAVYARAGSSQTLTLLTGTYWLVLYFLHITITLYTGALLNRVVCVGVENHPQRISLIWSILMCICLIISEILRK